MGVQGLKRELAPLEDRSNIRVDVRAPETASYEYTEHALDQMAFWIRDNVPEVARTYSITALFGGAVNTGVQNIYLKEPHERERSQEQIFQQVSRGLSDFDRLRIFPGQPPTIGERFWRAAAAVRAAGALAGGDAARAAQVPGGCAEAPRAPLRRRRPQGEPRRDGHLASTASAPPSSASPRSTWPARCSSPSATSASATS